jgi:hypothetical protein
VCAITEHKLHNVILLGDAAEAERTDVSELCAEASISEEEIQAELHKLEQKLKKSLDHTSTLHRNIDQEADALISRIHVCRQKAHEDVDEKMSSLIRALEEQRVSLEEMMACSRESRVHLVRALEEASDVSIFEHTREAKRQLISVLEEDVRKVDSKVEEEVFVSVARALVDLGKVDEMFEVRSRRVGPDRAVVLLSRGQGMIGHGLLDAVVGSTDIWIPPGVSVIDALLFVPGWNTRRIRVLNVSTGALVRDIVGDGLLGDYLYDVLISKTGLQGMAEMYVSDCSNHRIAVIDPMTGGHIRSIGRGEGAGMYIYELCQIRCWFK